MVITTFVVKSDQLDLDILKWYVKHNSIKDINGKLMTRGLFTGSLLREFIDDVAGPSLFDSPPNSLNVALLCRFSKRVNFNNKMNKIMGEEDN